MNDYLHQNWFQRNWKWGVPLGGCLIMVILAIVIITTVVSKVGDIINDTEPYQQALEKAQNSEWLISRLGEPIEDNGTTYTDYSYKNGSTVLDFQAKLKGSKDIEASLDVSANKEGDAWKFTVMEVSVDDSEEVYDLLSGKEIVPEDEDGEKKEEE